MKIPFYKYQGTGNDFIIIDNRGTGYLTRRNSDIIRWMCNRRFGIGGDGLILLQEKHGFDFEMVYFNSDGKEGSMCGNGGRCITSLACHLGLVKDSCTFLAIDGPHQAKIIREDWIELKMSDVTEIEKGQDYFVLDTGSPHYVIFVEDLNDINVVESGQVIRYSDRFREKGINVNFVERNNFYLQVATYERGVEDETLSCGTGVTAAAISSFYKNKLPLAATEIYIGTMGGDLQVKFVPEPDGAFRQVWLCGPAVQVFAGEYMVG